MSLFGPPTGNTDVVNREIKGFESKIEAQKRVVTGLSSKLKECEVKERETKLTIQVIEVARKDFEAKNKNAAGSKQYDNALKDFDNHKKRMEADLVKMKGKCTVLRSKRDLALGIENGLKEGLNEFKTKFKVAT
jgi:hypothetical protein